MTADSDSTPTKTCSNCAVCKPATTDFFHKANGKPMGLHSWCKKCRVSKKPADLRAISRAEQLALRNEKQCTKCGEVNPATSQFFHKQAKLKDGLAAQCAKCAAEQNAAWRIANADRVKTNAEAYYAKNKVISQQKSREWYSNNKDYANARSKKYASERREDLRGYAVQWRMQNLEKSRAYAKAWCAANPEKVRVRNLNRKNTVRAAGGKLPLDLRIRLTAAQKGLCPCCKQKLGDVPHLDHITPLALGGKNTADNMQLLRAECNLRKGAKHPIDYMQSKGFLL